MNRLYYYATPIYALSISVLYVWGYWSPFRINPLVFMGLEQVATAAIIPIATSFVAFAIGSILGQLLMGDVPPGGGSGTPFGRFLRRHERLIAFSYFAAILLFEFLSDSPNKWLVLPMLISMGLAIPLKRLGLFEGMINSDGIRTLLIFIAATLPLWAFGTGRINAQKVLDGGDVEYIVSTNMPSISSQIDSQAPCNLRLLGRIGNSVFVMEFPSQRLTVVEVGPGNSISTARNVNCKLGNS